MAVRGDKGRRKLLLKIAAKSVQIPSLHLFPWHPENESMCKGFAMQEGLQLDLLMKAMEVS